MRRLCAVPRRERSLLFFLPSKSIASADARSFCDNWPSCSVVASHEQVTKFMYKNLADEQNNVDEQLGVFLSKLSTNRIEDSLQLTSPGDGDDCLTTISRRLMHASSLRSRTSNSLTGGSIESPDGSNQTLQHVIVRGNIAFIGYARTGNMEGTSRDRLAWLVQTPRFYNTVHVH